MQKKRVAILQSSYLPWKGYFDIIRDVDLFIFYDDRQFTKQDWRSRNCIKSSQGLAWLTVPAGTDLNRLICDVTLRDASWQVKHWKTLQQNYAGRPHFDRYREYFEHVFLGQTWSNLSALNQSVIRHVAREFLGIGTAFGDSRDYAAEGQKFDRLLDLAIKSGATTYVSGPSAKEYIVPDRFAQAGIDLVWKDYSGYPEYPQRHPPFVHGVSILDLLFNVGPDAPQYIWGWRENAAP